MYLDIRAEIAQGLEALASAQGPSVEDYLQRLVARELPAHIVDEAVVESRAERSEHILGSHS